MQLDRVVVKKLSSPSSRHDSTWGRG